MRSLRGAALAFGLILAAGAEPAAALDVRPVPNAVGVEAWLVEEHSGTAVAMAFDFAGGSSQDPADRRGLTNLLVGLLYEGAGDLDSTAYKARLKDQSIQLGWEFDRDSVWGIMITPGANRMEAARLTNLALTAPRYDSADVERVRELILSGAKSRTPAQMALLAFMAALYPNHIYGVWESGDVKTLTAMTVPDLVAYRQKVLARDNLKVVVVGDVDGPGAAALVEAAFGGLPPKAVLAPIPDPAVPSATRIDTRGAVTQTSIRFGGPAPRRTERDYAAASAVAYLVGNRGPGFRLNDALVTGAGLTAAVTLSLNATNHTAWFAGNFTTMPDKSAPAITLLERELHRFADEGPTADELARAKTYLVSGFVGRFDTVPAVAVELVNEVAAGLGTDYPERYVAEVVALTPADLKRAAQRMFGNGLVIYTLAPEVAP